MADDEGTTPKDDAKTRDDARKDIAELLEKIPVVGPILALCVKRGWIAASLALILLFVILPVTTPLLASLYIKLLPEKLSDAYSEYVISAFGVKETIAEQVDQMIKDNNDRLDFVQQFHDDWVNPKQSRFPIYKFPIADGQRFKIEFQVEQPRPRNPPCKDGEKASRAAEEATNSTDLFSIKLNDTPEPAFATRPGEQKVEEFSEKFWTREKEKVARDQGTGRVEIILNTKQDAKQSSLAGDALKCFFLSSNLRVIVYKTIVNGLKKDKAGQNIRKDEQGQSHSSSPAGEQK